MTDVAETMNVLAGYQGTTPVGLTTTALQGKSIATVPDCEHERRLSERGRRTGHARRNRHGRDAGNGDGRAQRRRLTSSTAISTATWRRRRTPGRSHCRRLIDYNNANPTEGLKFQQEDLTGAEAVDTGDPATTSTYQTRPQSRGVGRSGADRRHPVRWRVLGDHGAGHHLRHQRGANRRELPGRGRRQSRISDRHGPGRLRAAEQLHRR